MLADICLATYEVQLYTKNQDRDVCWLTLAEPQDVLQLYSRGKTHSSVSKCCRGRTAASEATAAAGAIGMLTRGGSRSALVSVLLRLPLPLTLEVSVWPAVVPDGAL